MKRWNHSHSFLSGAATVGIFFTRHGWALFLAGILLGAAAVILWRTGSRLLRRLSRALPRKSLA